MHLDVVDLRNFYYRTGLGRAAQRMIRDGVASLWTPGEVKGQTVAGFGFAAPLLRPFLDEARRVINLMPGQQGVMPWPPGLPNVSVLCEETLWPVPTGRVDRLILLHGLETSENPTRLLEECWRVLGPGGRAIFIVPNRAGLWSRRDATPFGFGRPYSLRQLEVQLKGHNFVPERSLAALYQPPSHKRFWLRSGGAWETLGKKVPLLAGGVLIVEVSKQVYAQTGTGAPATARRRHGMLPGVAAPEVTPV